MCPTMYFYNWCHQFGYFNNICTVFVKHTMDSTTTAGINYTELYDCKWDPMTLTNNTLYTLAFKFSQIFRPDDGPPRPKPVANIQINKIQDGCV